MPTLRKFLHQVKINRSQRASLNQLKFFFRWKKSLEAGSSSVKDEQPWLTFEAINFLKQHIHPQSKIFEYGGGGSTLFFVKRALEVITVEHNKEWFQLLEEITKNKKLKNWKGFLVEPEKDVKVINPDKANPDHYSTRDEKLKRYNFQNYASFIERYPDSYFDIVLIDGRSRPSCIKHSLSKIKQGGFLVLDNSDRDYYLRFFRNNLDTNYKLIINRKGPCPYLIEFTQTSIWRKN